MQVKEHFYAFYDSFRVPDLYVYHQWFQGQDILRHYQRLDISYLSFEKLFTNGFVKLYLDAKDHSRKNLCMPLAQQLSELHGALLQKCSMKKSIYNIRVKRGKMVH